MRAPLVILVLLAGLWMVSEVLHPRMSRMGIGPSGMTAYAVRLGAGAVSFARIHEEDPIDPVGYVRWNWSWGLPGTPDRVHRRWLPTANIDTDLAPVFAWCSIDIPLWCTMLPVLAWLGVAYIRHHRKRALCPCGYDARGLDVCPECGRSAASPANSSPNSNRA